MERLEMPINRCPWCNSSKVMLRTRNYKTISTQILTDRTYILLPHLDIEELAKLRIICGECKRRLPMMEVELRALNKKEKEDEN